VWSGVWFGIVRQGKENKNKMNIEFKEIDNGWLVTEDYFGYRCYCKSFKEVEKKIQEFIKEYKKEFGM